MAVRTALLNGNNISRDTDFSKYIETVSEAGVIEGLTVTATKVAIGKGRVPCERTNGDTIFALVSVTSEVTISGNGDVFIQVSQTYIDNGELANEDGTGIATIQVGTMPAKNALKLATINNGVVTDARNMIVKVGELNTYIQSLNSRMNTAEQKIDQIIEDKAVDHLEETGLVGEKYTLANTLFKQLTPTFANASVDNNVGDVAANTAIHIQRLASGTASNKLKLKAKKIGAPTTGLVVEVRRGVQVDVSDTEAYWYGNELVCSGSIPYSSFSTDYQEFEVTMNGQFGGTKGEKLDIVVYQTGNIVNSTNYYAIACDSTQYSEGFSLVAVNGSTRTRSKLMPYCIADGFAQSMLCKGETNSVVVNDPDFSWGWSRGQDTKIYETTLTKAGKIRVISTFRIADNYSCDFKVFANNTQIMAQSVNRKDTDYLINLLSDNEYPAGTTVQIKVYESANQMLVKGMYIESVVARDFEYDHMGFPSDVKEIGEQVSINIYGVRDGIFRGGIIRQTTSTATTGSITLGNAVGFLEINFNGQIVKVPYYT